MQKFDLKKTIEIIYREFIDVINKKLEDRDEDDTQYKVYVPDFSKLKLDKGRVSGFGYVKTIIKKKGISLGYSHKYLTTISEFNDLVTFLKKKSQKPETVIISGIASLFKELYNKTHGKFNQESLEKYTNSLIEELGGKGFRFIANIFYPGIWLNKDEIKINKYLRLRKINEMDFQSDSMESFNNKFNSFKGIPLTVLEFKYYSKILPEIKAFPEAQRELNAELVVLDHAFRLFKLGSAFPTKKLIKSKTILHPSGITESTYEGKINPNYIYIIKENDIKKLKILIQTFRDLEIRKLFTTKSKKPNFISIALHRYQNAFTNAENLESHITYAIMCLEALFTENRPQLNRSLRERTTILLKTIRISPRITNTVIKKGYNIRSKYAHGSGSSKGDDELQRIANPLLEFTRLALLLLIQLSPNLSDINILLNYFCKKDIEKIKKIKSIKGKLIFLLDNAIIDNYSFKMLKKFILQSIKIF